MYMHVCLWMYICNVCMHIYWLYVQTVKKYHSYTLDISHNCASI